MCLVHALVILDHEDPLETRVKRASMVRRAILDFQEMKVVWEREDHQDRMDLRDTMVAAETEE